jgi:hypothetical protein
VSKKVKPKSAEIEKQMFALISAGEYKTKTCIARAVFDVWRKAHNSEELSWRHGTGKVNNRDVPDPDQSQPLSSWTAYVKGGREQNLDGWKMVANVLQVPVHRIVEIERRSMTSERAFYSQSAPGEGPLSKICNLDISKPFPRKGANAVSNLEGRLQAVALSAKPIFGTLRDEEVYDPEGNLVTEADVEATRVNILVKTVDPHMDVIDGIGFEGGEVVKGSIRCRYLGNQDGYFEFELSAEAEIETLAGTTQTLDELVALEGTFHRDDWIGLEVERGGLKIVRLAETDTDVAPTGIDRELKNQLKQQILSRGIVFDDQEQSSSRKSAIAVLKYFMRRVFDAGDS